MATPKLYLFNSGRKGARKKVVARSVTVGAKVRKAAKGSRAMKARMAALRALRGKKRSPVRARSRVKHTAAVRRRRARRNPLTASALAMLGSLVRKNPRRKRPSRVARTGAKNMARRRKKSSLSRNSKGRFVKRGKKSKAVRRRRRARRSVKRSPVMRRRRRRARRNPSVSVRRRRRARRNPTRAARRAEMEVLGGGGAKRGRRGKGRKKSRGRRSSAMVRRLTARIHQIEGGLRRRKSKKWSPSRSRLAVLKARRRVARGGGKLPSGARKYMSVHGLSKVRNNPSMAGAVQSLKALGSLVPDMLAAGAGMVGIGWVGNWGGQKLVAKWGASWAPVASAGVSLVTSILAFLGLRMVGATAKLSVPVLLGGVSGSIVNGLASVHGMAPEGGVALSLGRQLGLPIGDALTPGLSLGLDLHGAYLPRADFSGAYLPRQDLSGAYLPRADFSGLRGYLPVGATGDGQNQNVASTPGKLRALLNDHMDKMGDGPGF